MRFFAVFLVIASLAGCIQSGYKQFYKPYIDVGAVPYLEALSENAEPKVFGSKDFERDMLSLRAKKYVLVGESSFNGGYEDTKNAVAQAKEIGATLILVGSEYTNTQTTTSTLFIPDTRTTYHSGSVYGGSHMSTYNGSSTTTTTKAVPITSHQRRYDQTALYFVKSNQKYKFGIQVINLSPELRAKYERNTGIFVEVVIEDSPSFYSNVLAGDVVISIDGMPVHNRDHAVELMRNIPSDKHHSVLTVLRKGQKKEVIVNF